MLQSASRGGVCSGGGWLPGPGGCLLGGVSAPGGGVCSGGGCLVRGGVSAPGGCLVPRGGGAWFRGGLLRGGIPACTEADTLPPPVDRILDTRL